MYIPFAPLDVDNSGTLNRTNESGNGHPGIEVDGLFACNNRRATVFDRAESLTRVLGCSHIERV